MKRNMDLVRAILLAIEADGHPTLSDVPQIDGWSEAEVVHHLTLMIQASLVTAIDATTMDGVDYMETP